MLNLTAASEIEDRAHQLRRTVVFLLAGAAPEAERETWNLLLDMTDAFAVPPSSRAAIAWDRFAGDILHGLLALSCCGDEDTRRKVWSLRDDGDGGGGDEPAVVVCSRSHSVSDFALQNLTGIPLLSEPSVLPFAQARLARFLSPAEQRRCRDLFLGFCLGGADAALAVMKTTSNIFAALLPLLLAFPAAAAPSDAKDRQQQERVRLQRGVVAATVSGLLLLRQQQPLAALLSSVLEAKKGEPLSTTIESGFHIARLLAAPPVQYGLLLLAPRSSNTDDDGVLVAKWERAPSAKRVVEYFSSLLEQVADILLHLSPSFCDVQQQRREKSTAATQPTVPAASGSASRNTRVLTASVFFVGCLLAAPHTQSLPSSSHDLRAILCQLDAARLALVHRDLLAPFLTPDSNQDALFRLESLLTVLFALPGGDVVVSPSAQRAVLSVIAVVWDRAAGAFTSPLARAMLSPEADADDDNGDRCVARSCLRIAFAAAMEFVMLAREPQRRDDGEQDFRFMVSMLLRPVVSSAAALPEQLTPLVIDAMLHVSREAAALLLDAAAAGATTAPALPSPVQQLNRGSNGETAEHSLLVHLFFGELFKESVAVHSMTLPRTRADGGATTASLRQSDAAQSRMRFVCALACKIDIRSLLTSQAASSSASSIGGVLSFLEHLLTLCEWTLTAFSSSDAESPSQQQQLLHVTMLQLLEGIPALDSLLPAADATATAASTTKASLLAIRDQVERLLVSVAALPAPSGNSAASRLFAESVQRNLQLLRRSCDVMLLPSSSTAVEPRDNASAQISRLALVARQLRELLAAQVRPLFERRIWSAVCASLMDAANKLGSVTAKQLREDAAGQALLREAVAPEVLFVATRVLLVATAKREQQAASAASSAAAAGASSSVRSRMAAFRRKQNDDSAPTSSAALDSGDDLAINACCCFLSLAALMRLDDRSADGRNGATRDVLLSGLHRAWTLRASSAEAAAFAAALLDVLVRIADDDADGLTVRNIVFTAPAAAAAGNAATVEDVLLQVVRDAPDSASNATSVVEFQALRLCALNALGSCYQRVPRQCKLHVIEQIVVGIFRATASSSSSSSSDADRQVTRLAAAALLSSVAPALAVVIVADADDQHEGGIGETANGVPELRKLLGLCANLERFRSGVKGEQLAFDAEINAHGRAAQAAVKKLLPPAAARAVLLQE